MRDIVSYLEAFVKAKQRGLCVTLLGVGPMSDNVLRASLELAVEKDFPVMFIASRNQVDSACFGGGYVQGYNQADFAAAIAGISIEVKDNLGTAPVYFLCRDHGGPWQRDEERKACLPEDEAMSIALKSFQDDIDAGFNLLHVDPTKDPHAGAVVPMDVVIDRTLTLIRQLEAYRQSKNLRRVAYEVGTEETNGGQTGMEAFSVFIKKLTDALDKEGLPRPFFVVGQTGTLVRYTENVGQFSFKTAHDLSEVTLERDMLLKEHNSDYLPEIDLLAHLAAGVGGSNVAPEFGVVETEAYLMLHELEMRMFEDYGIKLDMKSNLREVMVRETIKSGRFRKWLMGEEAKLSGDEILRDAAFCDRVLRIGGHYVFNEPSVKAAIECMEDNLGQFGIPAKEYVIRVVKRSINRYVTAYDLDGLTSELEHYL